MKKSFSRQRSDHPSHLASSPSFEHFYQTTKLFLSLSLSLSLSLNHQHTNTPNYTAHNTLVALHLILSLSLHRIRLSNTRFLYDSLSMIHLPIATHFLTQQQRISYTLSLSISFVSLFCIYILAISLSSLSLFHIFRHFEQIEDRVQKQ